MRSDSYVKGLPRSTLYIGVASQYIAEHNSIIADISVTKKLDHHNQFSFTHFNPWVFFDGSIFIYGLDEKQVYVLVAAILVLLVVSIIQESGIKVRDKIAEQNLIFRWLIYLTALFVVIIFGMYGAGYNASDFIYMQF